MTHVLLDRELDSGQDIRRRLGRWGMTIGEYDSRHPDFKWPTILECDLVIMGAGSVSEEPSTGPESLAPVILLGVSEPLLLARDAWQALPDLKPATRHLRLAVQTCLEQSALLRHGPVAGQDREDFLSFIGHEMRSPLTAAKTALEVLRGDLGQLANQDSHLKMLEIALRNVRRLHNTVEWSQELMASSPGEQKIQLQDHDAGQLQETLGYTKTCRWEPEALQRRVHTDPDSLSMLMDQVVRALHYAIPGCETELNVRCSSEKNGLSLTLSPAHGSVQDGAPRVSRLGLAFSDPQKESPAADLERLVRFVVSGVLVSRLGVGLEVVGGQDEDPGIRILVPGAVVVAEDHQSVGQLLTSG